MYHCKLYSTFISGIQDEVFIISEFYKFGAHTINIMDIIFMFESTQQVIVSKNQNNMIGNFNQHHIYRWDNAILCFSLEHQSCTYWEMKYTCCDSNNNNNNHRYHKRLGACFKFPNGISTNCIMWCIGIVAHCSPV